MAGPAIRAVAIARELAKRWDVTLGLRFSTDRPPAGLEVLHPVRARDLARFDVLVAQIAPIKILAAAYAMGVPLVLDAYDPLLVEQLEFYRDCAPAARRLELSIARSRARAELLGASYILAASERQRDFYLGQLALLGRATPSAYDRDARLESLIGVVPFGVSEEPPPTERLLKGKLSGVAKEDEVLLWGGGVWNWFDPLTAIRAMPAILRQRPRAKLVFLGTRHPNPQVPAMRMLGAAIDAAREAGLYGTAVIFNEGWVPYARRGGYFADANLGVSLHGSHLETRFSFRTRVLDYIWAGLPMVLAEGDVLAEIVAQEGAALLVPCGDSGRFAEAVLRALDPAWQRAARARLLGLSERFRWPSVLAPLVGAIDRISRRERPPAPPARARALFAIAPYALALARRKLYVRRFGQRAR